MTTRTSTKKTESRRVGWSAEPLKIRQGLRAATYDSGRRVIWILTSGDQVRQISLTRYDPETDAADTIDIEGEGNGIGYSSPIDVDDMGFVWAAWGRRLIRFDPSTKKLTEWKVPLARGKATVDSSLKGFVADMAIDGRGRILLTVQTYAELKRFDPATSVWESFPIWPLGGSSGQDHLVALDDDHIAISGAQNARPGVKRHFAAFDVRTKKLRMSSVPAWNIAQVRDGVAYASIDGEIGIFDPRSWTHRVIVRARWARAIRVDERGRFWLWQAPANIEVVDPSTGKVVSYKYPFISRTLPPEFACRRRSLPRAPTPSCDPSRPITIGVDAHALVINGKSTAWIVSHGFIDGTGSAGAYPTLYRLDTE